MGDWYRVTKRINGRLYDYWQRTHRVGKSVKTQNRYIGPASINQPLGTSTYSTTAPDTPEHILPRIAPFGNPATDNQRVMARLMERIRREDEAIQYGPLAARIRKQEAAVRAAKRATKGIKATNPFLAKALK